MTSRKLKLFITWALAQRLPDSLGQVVNRTSKSKNHLAGISFDFTDAVSNLNLYFTFKLHSILSVPRWLDIWPFTAIKICQIA